MYRRASEIDHMPDGEDLITVLAISAELIDVANPFGQIKGASITLQGSVLFMSSNLLKRKHTGDSKFNKYTIYFDIGQTSISCPELAFIFVQQIRLTSTFEGLVLAPTDDRRASRAWECSRRTAYLRLRPGRVNKE
jgi:hypothetical protein